jgi:hypothetical protein
MDLVVTGVVAGVLGTLVMDMLNLLFARMGMLSQIDMGMIGRMSVGWAHGRFRYRHPSEMEQVANEILYDYVTHYTIGVGLAVTYVLGWDLLVGGPASPVWAPAYGTVVTGGTTSMSGFTIIEADSMEAALLIAKGCPFLDIGGSLEVSESIQMPGQK